MYVVGVLYNLGFEADFFLVSLTILLFLWCSVFLVTLVVFIEESGREGRERKAFILLYLTFIPSAIMLMVF